jgi:CDP-diacylglycerol--glycerol-3-phosphate 3-phosphatidyltransferase/cardiolipin synthase
VHDNNRLRKAPYIVVALRIVLAPLFLYAYLLEFDLFAIAFFIIVALSDIIDGQLAKKLEVTSKSSLEAYSDAVADFVFIITSFFAFVINGIYPFWIPIMLTLMFLFFLLTSNSKYPIYDPIGKYYGSFLVATIGFTLFFPMLLVYNIIFFSIIIYSVVLIFYRTIFLFKSRKEDEY